MTTFRDIDTLYENVESKGDATRVKKIAAAWSPEGIKDRAKKHGLDFLASPFVQTLMDVAQRWESARVAYFIDQESGAISRELFGDTSFGDKAGFDSPRYYRFDDLYEGFGVPEGGRLSEVVGERWFTPYWDPTARGGLAFATDVVSDPVTWVTPAGAGAAANKIVGKAGVVNLTPKGAKLVEKVYKSRVFGAAREIGEEVGDVAKMSTDDFIDLEFRVLQKQRDKMGMEALGEAGLGHAQTRLYDEAASRVADRLAREGTRGLTYEAGLRAFDMTFMGVPYRGVTVVPKSKVSVPMDALRSAIRSGTPGPILGRVDAVVDVLDKTFKRVPQSLRANQLFKQLEEQRFVTRNSANSVIDEQMQFVYGPMLRRFETDDTASKLLMHYIENPKKYADEMAEYFGKDADAVKGVAERWTTLSDGMGGAGVKMNLIEADQFEKYSGKYISHRLKDIDEQLHEELFNKAITPKERVSAEFKGGSMYGYGRERHASSLDVLRRTLHERGYDPDKHIDYNAPRVMSEYIRTHVHGIADANFANDIVAEFSPTFQTVLRNLAPDTYELAEKATPTQLATMQRALSRAAGLKGTPLFNDEYKQALKEIEGFDPVMRAAYVYERLARIKNHDEFLDFMGDHQRILNKVSNRDLSSLRDYRKTGAYKVDGHSFVEHSFDAGAMKGQTRIIPAHMRAYFIENSTTLSRSLPEPLEKALKYWDLWSNTFKSTHTIFALKFHTRNAISNVAAVHQAANMQFALDPARFRRTLKIMRGEGDFTIKTATGKTYTREHLTRLHQANDIMPKRVQLTEAVGDRPTLLQSKPLSLIGAGWAERKVGQLAQGVENMNRGVYFQSLLESGYTPRRAAQLTKEALFDYSDLSRTEKEFFKRVLPFYTWTRKNIEQQMKNAIQRPANTSIQLKALTNWERGPEEGLLPEYMNGDLKVKLSSDPGKATFISNIDLPIQNLNAIWAGGLRETIKEWYGMINPFLKGPQEYYYEQDSFTGNSLRGRQFMGTVGKQMAETMPGPVVEYLQLEQVELSNGDIAYKGNPLRMWLLLNNGIIGRLVRDTAEALATAKELGNGDTAEGSRMLVKLLTGLNIQHIDLTEAQRRKVKESIRALEDEAVSEGRGYKIDIFVPNRKKDD